MGIGIGGLIDTVDFGKNRLGFSHHLLRLGLGHPLQAIAQLIQPIADHFITGEIRIVMSFLGDQLTAHFRGAQTGVQSVSVGSAWV